MITILEKILKLVVSFSFFFCISLVVFAQKDLSKSDTNKIDLPNNHWRNYLQINGLRIGFEVPIQGFLMQGITDLDKVKQYYQQIQQYELNTEWLLAQNRYLLAFDLGQGSAKRENVDSLKGFRYENKGYYFRIGLEYNALAKRSKKEALTIGLHYGRAFFDQELRYNSAAPVWNLPVYQGVIPKESQSASWLELSVGLRTRIWQNLFCGFNFRYKLLLGISENILKANEIAGFGKTASASHINFTYHIYYLLPFKN